MSAYEFFFFMYELKCAIEAQFKIKKASSSVLLGGISHSTSILIFRNMWGKNTKTLFGWLKADLMNVKWKLHRLDTVFPHFDEGEIITIDVGAGHAEDKRGPSPLLELQLLKDATTTLVQSHYGKWMSYGYAMHSNW